MAQPYVGEIRMFGGNFAPVGWAFCDGQLLAITENETLFQLIGTTYGGDGVTTFALPDLRARIPVHAGSGILFAEAGGVEEVTLTVQQVPAHTHPLAASTDPATDSFPAGAYHAGDTAIDLYGTTPAPLVAMAPAMVSPVGGSQPHENLQPFLCIRYIISLFGIFPSPT